tara:strand:+ start:35 stop:622 length:588 start_codon:yes stop_codon:yes gene_type:complete
MSEIIKVVGIDMALANVGLVFADVDLHDGAVVIRQMDLVKTAKTKSKQVRASSDNLQRARQIHGALNAACAQCHLAIAEVPTGGQSASTARAFGIATGLLATLPIPLIEVDQKEVKLASVGKKTASKEEMISWATELHPSAPWLVRKLKGKQVLMNDNEHLADAVAVIYAGIRTAQYAQAVAMMRSMIRAVAVNA